MLDELFTFPMVTIDGDNEERKIKDRQRFGDLPNADGPEEEYDVIYGEAEYPYWDFIGIEDRWLPSSESFQKAMKGKFEACLVRFLHVGQILVPWSKRKFKAELLKFSTEYEAANPPKQTEKKTTIPIMTLSPEQYKKIIGDGTKPEG